MQHTSSLGLYEHYFSTKFCSPVRPLLLATAATSAVYVPHSDQLKTICSEPPAGTVIFGHLLCVRGTASAYLQRTEVMCSKMSVHQATARGQWFVRGLPAGSSVVLSS